MALLGMQTLLWGCFRSSGAPCIHRPLKTCIFFSSCKLAGMAWVPSKSRGWGQACHQGPLDCTLAPWHHLFHPRHFLQALQLPLCPWNTSEDPIIWLLHQLRPQRFHKACVLCQALCLTPALKKKKKKSTTQLKSTLLAEHRLMGNSEAWESLCTREGASLRISAPQPIPLNAAWLKNQARPHHFPAPLLETPVALHCV